MKHKFLFCDLDGVIGTSNLYRNYLVPRGTDEDVSGCWAPWHRAHYLEHAVPKYIKYVQLMQDDGWELVIVTARYEENRTTTVRQLSSWDVRFNSLIMMPDECILTPSIWKTNVLASMQALHRHFIDNSEEHITPPEYLLLDDNDYTCQRVWKMLNIPSINVVTEGKYVPPVIA